MGASEFVVRFFDKKYEKLSFEELCKAPVSAISEVSESDAADLDARAHYSNSDSEFISVKYMFLGQIFL